MKLILEKDKDGIYAYFESKKHFKIVEPKRETPLLNSDKLNDEINNEYGCILNNYKDFHMVFDIKGQK